MFIYALFGLIEILKRWFFLFFLLSNFLVVWLTCIWTFCLGFLWKKVKSRVFFFFCAFNSLNEKIQYFRFWFLRLQNRYKSCLFSRLSFTDATLTHWFGSCFLLLAFLGCVMWNTLLVWDRFEGLGLWVYLEKWSDFSMIFPPPPLCNHACAPSPPLHTQLHLSNASE